MQPRERSYQCCSSSETRFGVDKLTSVFQVCPTVIILLRLVLSLVSYS
jgi:hypothetical protein